MQLNYNGRFTFSGIQCTSSLSDIVAAAKEIADSALSVVCSQVPGLNCGPYDKVTISTICGRDIDVSSSSSRRRHLSSDNEVNFSLILNAIAESDLRQKDALIGQYLQGSNLNNILTDIRTALSSTTTTTLSSITAMYYSFVDSVIRGLGLYYPAWGTSETCFNDGNQDGKKAIIVMCHNKL